LVCFSFNYENARSKKQNKYYGVLKMNHLVVSKCSWNHFNSDKSKTVSFNPYPANVENMVSF